MNKPQDKANDTRARYSHSDIWTGIVLILVGFFAAWLAKDFDDVSRPYPLTLGIIMAIFGLIIIGRVFLEKGTHTSFALPSKVTGYAGVIIILWILAISNGFGYLLPTFFMQLAFLWVCGVKEIKKSAIIATSVSVLSYLVFIIGLGVRMPDSLANWLI